MCHWPWPCWSPSRCDVGRSHRVAAGAGLRLPRGSVESGQVMSALGIRLSLTAMPDRRSVPCVGHGVVVADACHRLRNTLDELVDLVRVRLEVASERPRRHRGRGWTWPHWWWRWDQRMSAGRGRVGHRPGVHVGLSDRVGGRAGLRRSRGERVLGQLSPRWDQVVTDGDARQRGPCRCWSRRSCS